MRAFNPWDEITTAQALAELFARGGVAGPEVVATPGQQHLDSPDNFWDIVLGTGYRATIDALSQEQRTQVQRRVLGELRSRNITTVRTDVVFGTATRPR